MFWVVSLNTLFILVFGKWGSKESARIQLCSSALSLPADPLITQLLSFSAAFCPYHIGHFGVVGLGLEDCVSARSSILSEALCLS